MANSSGYITAPVREVADIANVLGVGTYKISTLCTSDNINKFSKVKPIDYPSITELTDDQRYKYCYGLTNFSVSYVLLPTAVWGYTKPKGGESSPYRFSDFKGYYHKAKSPINSIVFPSVLANDGTTTYSGSFDVAISFHHDTSNTKEVELRDLLLSSGSITNYYPTVILHRKDGSTNYYWAQSGEYSVSDVLSQNSTVKGFGASLSIAKATGFYNAAAGTTVNCIACLCSSKLSGTSSLSGYNFVSLNCEDGVAVVQRDIVRNPWWEGLSFSITASITKSVSSSSGFSFKINSLKATVSGNSSYTDSNFYAKVFLKMVGEDGNYEYDMGSEVYILDPSASSKSVTFNVSSSTYTTPYGKGGAAIIQICLSKTTTFQDGNGANIYINFGHSLTEWTTEVQSNCDSGLTKSITIN